MGRHIQVAGVLVFVIGLVLVILGAADVLNKAIRSLLTASLLKRGPDHAPESTEPDVSTITFVVWNYTNLEASGASKDVMAEVVPLEYIVTANKLTGEVFRTFPNDGEIVRTQTVGGRTWYEAAKPDQFTQDVIVQPNVLHFSTITIARPYLIPGALGRLQSAENTNNVTLSARSLTPLIPTLELQAAFYTLFMSSANIVEFFGIQIRGDSVNGDPKYAGAGVVAANEKYVAAMLNQIASGVVSSVAGIPNTGVLAAAKFPVSYITPQFVFLSIANKRNCTSYEDPKCENRGILTYQEVDSGKLDISKIGQLRSINGSQSTLAWGPPADSFVGSSNGQQISPFQLDPNAAVTSFSLWTTELSRKLPFSYASVDTIHANLRSRRYLLDKSLMQSYKTNPDNAHYQNWGPDGVANIAPVAKGAPMWISLPHMLHGPSDSSFGISGYNPDPVKHETFIDVEPNSGFVIAGLAGMQTNLRVESGMAPLYPKLVKGSYTFFPIYYERLGGEIKESQAKDLASLVKALALTRTVGQVMLISGIVLGLLGVSMCYAGRRKKIPLKNAETRTPGNADPVVMRSAKFIMMGQQAEAGQAGAAQTPNVA